MSDGHQRFLRHQRFVSQSPPPSTHHWQSDRDTKHRRDMIQEIVKILKKNDNHSKIYGHKLPQMAKQLEVSLYRQAQSFSEYMDMSTLKQRLQAMAVTVSCRSNNSNTTPYPAAATTTAQQRQQQQQLQLQLQQQQAQAARAAKMQAEARAAAGLPPLDTPTTKNNNNKEPPFLRGMLHCDVDNHRQVVSGIISHPPPSSTTTLLSTQQQQFEWIRILHPSEDPTVLPRDGVFFGTEYYFQQGATTSPNKKCSRSKAVHKNKTDNVVKISFTRMEGGNTESMMMKSSYSVVVEFIMGITNSKPGEDNYIQEEDINNNNLHVDQLEGKAIPSSIEGDSTYYLVLRKPSKE